MPRESFTNPDGKLSFRESQSLRLIKEAEAKDKTLSGHEKPRERHRMSSDRIAQQRMYEKTTIYFDRYFSKLRPADLEVALGKAEEELAAALAPNTEYEQTVGEMAERGLSSSYGRALIREAQAGNELSRDQKLHLLRDLQEGKFRSALGEHQFRQQGFKNVQDAVERTQLRSGYVFKDSHGGVRAKFEDMPEDEVQRRLNKAPRSLRDSAADVAKGVVSVGVATMVTSLTGIHFAAPVIWTAMLTGAVGKAIMRYNKRDKVLYKKGADHLGKQAMDQMVASVIFMRDEADKALKPPPPKPPEPPPKPAEDDKKDGKDDKKGKDGKEEGKAVKEAGESHGQAGHGPDGHDGGAARAVEPVMSEEEWIESLDDKKLSDALTNIIKKVHQLDLGKVKEFRDGERNGRLWEVVGGLTGSLVGGEVGSIFNATHGVLTDAVQNGVDIYGQHGHLVVDPTRDPLHPLVHGDIQRVGDHFEDLGVHHAVPGPDGAWHAQIEQSDITAAQMNHAQGLAGDKVAMVADRTMQSLDPAAAQQAYNLDPTHPPMGEAIHMPYGTDSIEHQLETAAFKSGSEQGAILSAVDSVLNGINKLAKYGRERRIMRQGESGLFGSMYETDSHPGYVELPGAGGGGGGGHH